MQNEILLKPVLYISHFFKQNRGAYYERLQAVRDHGDWEGWIKFFLTGIATVSQVQKMLKITYPPANALVQRFVKAGILFEVTGQERYRVY